METFDELFRLTCLAIDGSITTEDFASLESMLRNDPKAVRAYVEFMATHHALCSRGQKLDADRQGGRALVSEVSRMVDYEPAEPLSVAEYDAGMSTALEFLFEDAEESRRAEWELQYKREAEEELAVALESKANRSSRRRFWLATAAGLALTSLIVTLLAISSKPGKPVATFAKNDSAVFAEEVIAQGDVLREGRFELLRGVARIDFNRGARAIIEAPAVFELSTDNRMVLERGRAMVTVPAKAKGFRVDTPMASIVDLGTEFAAFVGSDGQVEVYVFTGRVEIRPVDSGESTGDPIVALKEDEARQINQPFVSLDDESMEEVSIDRRAFVFEVGHARETNEDRAAAASAITFGNALGRRAMSDSATGSLFVQTIPLKRLGKATNWAFFDTDDKGASVTPLLFKKSGSDWRVVGIGTTRVSDGTGVQAFSFGLVSGSDEIEEGVFFGWKDGSNGADNPGVIDFDLGETAGAVWLGSGKTTFHVGDQESAETISSATSRRTYSLQVTIQPHFNDER